jgi:cephalosporin hydroxylase
MKRTSKKKAQRKRKVAQFVETSSSAQSFVAEVVDVAKVFNEDKIVRNDIPKDVFGLIHDLAYDHEGRDRWQYRDRAQALLSHQQSTPTQEAIEAYERSKKDGSAIVDAFHSLYYHGEVQVSGFPIIRPISAARYLGLPIGKSPLDLWIYQEIIYETRPDLIIEAGSGTGASALWMATICETLGNGGVVSVDTHEIRRRPHGRVVWVGGDILSERVEKTLRDAASKVDRIMIVFDDDHAGAHVTEELEKYCDLVTRGCYLCIEDGDVNGHPVYPEHGDGPYEAIMRFLPKHPEFDVDFARFKYLFTTNPLGYLVRY